MGVRQGTGPAGAGPQASNCCCDPANLVGDITGTRSVPPFEATGVEMFSFPVGASFIKLSALCDKYLNDPAPNAPSWRPLSSMFYIQVLKYDRLVSEPYDQFGFIRQNELVFQIPIISPLNPALPNVGFFSAYLVVDNPLSLTVGREVFGYPKTFGSFQIQPTQISVSNWLTPAQGPNQEYAEHPLLDQTGLAKLSFFSQTRSLQNGIETEGRSSLWPFGPVEKLFRPKGYKPDGEEAPPPFELDEEAWPMLFDKTAVPIVHANVSVQALKETDSTTFLTPGPQKAAYQARISAQSTPTNLLGSGLLASDPLTIHQYDPLDLIDILGITTLFGSVPVFWPFWNNLDFTVHDTTLLTCRC